MYPHTHSGFQQRIVLCIVESLGMRVSTFSLVPRLPSFFGGYAEKAGRSGDEAKVHVHMYM